jgi:hypothetical protein
MTTWELVEITFPWPWVDCNTETLEKSFQKKIGMYDGFQQEIQDSYPDHRVAQAIIVVSTLGVFHKLSQIEFEKRTRLKWKDLARRQRNVVDMALRGSYNIGTESMEKWKFNREHSPHKEKLAILDAHEVDLLSGED